MFNHGGDLCLGFFKEMYEAGRVPIPQGARVLEVGCAEFDACGPLKAARPDVHLTAVDWRKVDRPAADVLLQGNLLDQDLFPASSFDVILAVSVIEHVGIGRYQDPVVEDGDTQAMAHLRRWLRPSGLVYLDVPYRGAGRSTPFRAYSEADLQRRVIAGWTEVDRQEFEGRQEGGDIHCDAPYIALVLRP